MKIRFILFRGEAAARDRSSVIVSAIIIFMLAFFDVQGAEGVSLSCGHATN
jgi:hypothetical protein